MQPITEQQPDPTTAIPTVEALVKSLPLPRHLEREDAFQVGMIGAIKAARNFRPEKGASFLNYARMRAHHEIQDELRRMTPGSRGRWIDMREHHWPEGLEPADERSTEEFEAVATQADDEKLLTAVEENAAISGADRLVLNLTILGETTGVEVARMLGVTGSMISHRRKRILARLARDPQVRELLGADPVVRGLLAA